MIAYESRQLDESLQVNDILYGKINIPEWFHRYIFSAGLLRLRGVGLSNFDSLEYKDFGGANRWCHSLGVFYLASACAEVRRLSDFDTKRLQLAALFHDAMTPPFAHTLESILPGFDHEIETANALTGRGSSYTFSDSPNVLGEEFGFDAPSLRHAHYRFLIGDQRIAQIITGDDDDLGFLIHGTLDLDNADNVVRANRYMGFDVDPQLPLRLARYLGSLAGPPLELRSHPHPDIKLWLSYRDRMYSSFFRASRLDRAREAHLQHLLRRAYRSNTFDWTWFTTGTEARLLDDLRTMDNEQPERLGGRASHQLSVAELVRRYELVDHPMQFLSVPIHDSMMYASLASPEAVSWIEDQLKSEYLEVAVMASKRRFQQNTDLDPTIVGELRFFAFTKSLDYWMLPSAFRTGISANLKGQRLITAVQRKLSVLLPQWAASRDWRRNTAQATRDIRRDLERVPDWGFSNSQNRSLHAYPSTFVRNIPATLIHVLGLSGGSVLDPFGGTGNTALESVRQGGIGISADVNPVATLIASVWATYLDDKRRSHLSGISIAQLEDATPAPLPEFHRRDSWHHPDTLAQLCQIAGFVNSISDPAEHQFLKLCFSAILPSATHRRGRGHGWFADNTPLPKGVQTPKYQDALADFTKRVSDNLHILEWRYALLEDKDLGRSAGDALERMRVLRVDVADATPESYGLAPGSVDGIVTSPPYLCMTDYTLGQRLSYGWFPDWDMEEDFGMELGARRLRGRRDALSVFNSYTSGMSHFAQLCHDAVRPGGVVAIVLGQPTADAFADIDVLAAVDDAFADCGLGLTWKGWRNIHWSRNHAFARLKQERVSVYQR